jgi:hypothetical protein
MLGDEQRTWLCDGLMGASTRWVGWANEVLSLPLRLSVGPLAVQPLVDSWDGYPAERERVFAALRDADGAAATLTGDLHSTVVGNQWLDGTCVGIEVMTPAVTSVNVAEAVNLDEGLRGRLTRPLLARAVEAANPHIDRFDSHATGSPSTCTPSTRRSTRPTHRGHGLLRSSAPGQTCCDLLVATARQSSPQAARSCNVVRALQGVMTPRPLTSPCSSRSATVLISSRA